MLIFPEVFSFRDKHRRQIGVTPFSALLFVTSAKLFVRCTLHRAGLTCDQKINKYAYVECCNILFTLDGCNSQAGTTNNLRSGSSLWSTASETNYLLLFHTEASTGGRANWRLTACLPAARTRFSSGSKWDTGYFKSGDAGWRCWKKDTTLRAGRNFCHFILQYIYTCKVWVMRLCVYCTALGSLINCLY